MRYESLRDAFGESEHDKYNVVNWKGRKQQVEDSDYSESKAGS